MKVISWWPPEWSPLLIGPFLNPHLIFQGNPPKGAEGSTAAFGLRTKLLCSSLVFRDGCQWSHRAHAFVHARDAALPLGLGLGRNEHAGNRVGRSETLEPQRPSIDNMLWEITLVMPRRVIPTTTLSL